ncbi:SDR family oxidoreductase [Nocardioides sp.]|uniref:SDR family oxidoreductase n=1 Tax=Nocardioides sp. TaxID=35761 RepID=UPI00351362CF
MSAAGGARLIAITGAASGMGAAAAARLRAAGDTVVGLDRQAVPGVDVVADLSTAEGRAAAVAGVREVAGGRLDGLVLAAGLGPVPGRERTLLEVNLRGAVELLQGLRPLLAASERGRAVVLGSNSTTTTPFVGRRVVRTLLDDDLDAALERLAKPRNLAAARCYAASKTALTHWVRRAAATPEWAGAGIRLNVLAPGAVATPLLQEQLAGKDGDRVRKFPIPAGGPGTPEQLAHWVEILLSDAADFMVGSVVTVDGGSEAYLRPASWPRSVPTRELPRYLVRLLR